MTKPFDITNERKLTDHDVLVIRAVHTPKHLRFGSVTLAQLFGVSQPTIDRLVKRETYRHLHPLLLPALHASGEGRFASTTLGGRTDGPGKQAQSKTEYADTRRWVRYLFGRGDYIPSLRGEFQVDRDGRYVSRKAKPRPPSPKVLAHRARVRQQATERRLARSVSKEEFLAGGGKGREAIEATDDNLQDQSREELLRRFARSA